MSTLERAITIAAQAHQGQTDKAHEPYILHPIRVMLRLSTPDERMAAVLHDVLEDTDWSRTDLEREGFSRAVLDAVEALTRRSDETYEDFLHRVSLNPIALRVKLADLEDNLDASRIAQPTDRDVRRMEKYRAARALLESVGAG
ncbi:MAG: HD domain-containing protein [Syntrophobacteraceae bacterium]|nr:HD domain-containing protein [Syntrophobacteraceae bacterium]